MSGFEGALTALVTPFRGGQVDEKALRELVERQIAGRIDGLVPCGTTGESVTLSTEEHARVVRTVVEQALSGEWDERLVRAYGSSAGSEGSPALLAQIARCEEWAKTRPNDAELELTLGVLCFRQKLWGKAQRHLENALSNASEAEAVREAHLKLAQLHEALNQSEQAAVHYRQCALATIL